MIFKLCWITSKCAIMFQNFVLMTVEAGADQDNLSFWDWEGDALLGRVQVKSFYF